MNDVDSEPMCKSVSTPLIAKATKPKILVWVFLEAHGCNQHNFSCKLNYYVEGTLLEWEWVEDKVFLFSFQVWTDINKEFLSQNKLLAGICSITTYSNSFGTPPVGHMTKMY